MTDLSSLFRPKPALNTPITTPPTSTLLYSSLPHYPSPSPSLPTYSLPKYETDHISVSRQVKKTITYNNMQEQVQWFLQQNLFQWIVKICIIGIGIGGVWATGLMSGKIALCLFVFQCLMFANLHCVFSNKIVRLWALSSLVYTTLTLTNELFLTILSYICPQTCQHFNQSYLSLLPSFHITTLSTLLILSLPLLLPQQNQSCYPLQPLINLPNRICQLIKILYLLKYTILQLLAVLLIGSYVGSLLCCWVVGAEVWEDWIQGIVDWRVFVSVVLCFFGVAGMVVAILQFGSAIGNMFAFIYNNKHKITKVPIMLQLLRINQSNTYTNTNNRIIASSQYPNQSILSTLQKFLNISPPSFTLFSSPQPLPSAQLHNIHLHSLSYLTNLLYQNQFALSTPILTSKFYSNYYEILQEFVLKQIQKCYNYVFRLDQCIRELETLRINKKYIWEDALYYLRVFAKQMEVWKVCVLCCLGFEVVDGIIYVMMLSEDKYRDRLGNGAIGTNLRDICNRIQELKDKKGLNPVVKNKMQQQSNKIQRLLKNQ